MHAFFFIRMMFFHFKMDILILNKKNHPTGTFLGLYITFPTQKLKMKERENSRLSITQNKTFPIACAFLTK